MALLKRTLAVAGQPNENKVVYTQEALLNIYKAWEQVGEPEFAVVGIGDKPVPDIHEVAARVHDIEFDGEKLEASVIPHDMLPAGRQVEALCQAAEKDPSLVSLGMAVTVTEEDFEKKEDGTIEIRNCMLKHIGIVVAPKSQSRNRCDSEQEE